MRARPPVHCAYCDQQLEIGERGRIVAVGGRDCTGPSHSPRSTCDRCGTAVHVDLTEVDPPPQGPGAEYLRYLSPPTYTLVDEHGSPECPAGGAGGHSLDSSSQRVHYRLALLGFVALCLAALAFLVVTASDDSAPREPPAGAGADVDGHRW